MGDILNFDSEEYDFIRAKAEEYNVTVRIRPLSDDIRGYTIGGEIILNEYMYPERRNWTFCHELGHIVLGHSSEPCDEEEREADVFAAETMLPEIDFIPDSRGLNLIELKQIYQHASWEVIARRCLQFHEMLISIFDEGRLTFRAGTGNINFTKFPLSEETLTMKECYEQKKSLKKYFENFSVDAYYIDEAKEIIRVILITQFEAGFE